VTLGVERRIIAKMPPTRRDLLKAAALAAAAPAAGAAPRYTLGCQTLPYAALPLARAIEGIRKAGYRHVMPYHAHAKELVFTPDLPPAARAELRRRFADAGLTPFMSFIGLRGDLRKPDGFNLYLAELDLCAEFGIRTVVGIGPWYFQKFPNIPKRARDWQREVDAFYPALERAVRHAETTGVTIALKPHTGITAHAAACLQVVARVVSDRLKICWDAGNVSFYEGIWPDPDLPDLAPHVKAVCIKDHLGGRGAHNFPVPGQGQIDHDQMFRALFAGGFSGPLALERVDGTDRAASMPPELIDERIAAARRYLEPLLEKTAAGTPGAAA
jgi:sugar phosphate isomerase/epimerase